MALDSLAGLLRNLLLLPRELEDVKLLVGRLLVDDMLARAPFGDLREAEVRVFSQFGDDGIIQYLVGLLEPPELFIEFGVEDYRESNTRFLLLNDHWSGIVLDSSKRNLRAIRADRNYWREDLRGAVAFVTRDNVDGHLSGQVEGRDVGLLSIDIDGNDYWVWKAIESVKPVIVVIEYNSVLGAERAVTVPYEERFDRTRAHHSGLYFGASISAIARLGAEKGYSLVGSNSAGNNAYLVRRDRMRPPLRELPPAEAHVVSRHRESRDRSGKLNFLRGEDRATEIAVMPLWDVARERLTTVGESSAPPPQAAGEFDPSPRA